MESLAVKYRPKTFEDVCEQGTVVDILRNICNSRELYNRNFLFTGPSGTGKTTLARAMANILNEGKSEPIEIDAASHSGVDAMRELIKQARQYPVGANYKVFIIDEAHSISNAGWQSLLKTLEEGPAKSIFMFATTNPEKIPATILSRVQTFQLSKISLGGIISRLTYVLDSEISEGRHITYTEDGVQLLAKLARGGMRDSLTMLDTALAYSLDINSENIIAALNLPNYDEYFALLGSCAKHNDAKIIEIIDDVYNSGVNFINWFEGFHAFVINVVKYILLKDISRTSVPVQYEAKISKYTEAHCAVCLKLSNRLLELISALKTTQYLQEVAITHLCKSKSSGGK